MTPRGLGKQLVDTCLVRLASAGIEKCHIFLHADNDQGQGFWQKIGWNERRRRQGRAGAG